MNFKTPDMIESMTTNEQQFFIQLGQRLSSLRKQASMTQSQLGERLGVSQPVIASYEAGRRRVPSSTLPIISNLFNITLDQLVSGSGTTKSRQGRPAKAQTLFDQLSKLPRSQQQRILATVEDMLAAQKMKEAQAS